MCIDGIWWEDSRRRFWNVILILSRGVRVIWRLKLRVGGFFFYNRRQTDVNANDVIAQTVIKTVFEIVDSDSRGLDMTELEVRLNHSSILNTVLSSCGIRKSIQITTLLEQLQKPLSFQELKNHLLVADVSKESIELLEKYHISNSSFESSFLHIQSLLPPPDFKKIEKELLQLSDLYRYLRRLGLSSCRIGLVPLLSYNANYYEGGVMFQIAYTNRKKLGEFIFCGLIQRFKLRHV
jgi:histidyl-tRNA synthetase